MMNDARKTGRRTSDRLREKEDIPIPNGIGHSTTKSGDKATVSEKQTKANGGETVTTGKKTRGKRKLGMSESIWERLAIGSLPFVQQCLIC